MVSPAFATEIFTHNINSSLEKVEPALPKIKWPITHRLNMAMYYSLGQVKPSKKLESQQSTLFRSQCVVVET